MSISSDVAAAALPPMLVLPVVQAMARHGAGAAALRIEATLGDGALLLAFSRGDGSTEPLFDAGGARRSDQRLARGAWAAARPAPSSSIDPGTLTLRLPVFHELDQADRADR